MPQPAARQGDPVLGTDIHIILVPSFSGTTPVPTPHPFSGTLTSGTIPEVLVNGRPAAVTGSIATNAPPHVPIGGTFQRPPSNQGRVLAGSPSVLAGGTPMARAGDQVATCNDPSDLPTSTITGGSPDVVLG